MCPCEPTAQHRSHHQGVGHTLTLILYRALLNTQQQTDAVNTLQVVVVVVVVVGVVVGVGVGVLWVCCGGCGADVENDVRVCPCTPMSCS